MGFCHYSGYVTNCSCRFLISEKWQEARGAVQANLEHHYTSSRSPFVEQLTTATAVPSAGGFVRNHQSTLKHKETQAWPQSHLPLLSETNTNGATRTITRKANMSPTALFR